MPHKHAKGQGQRSLGSKSRVEMDRQTDGDDCITFRANAVGSDVLLCVDVAEDYAWFYGL